jgi:cation-transporting P-type ATPase F
MSASGALSSAVRRAHHELAVHESVLLLDTHPERGLPVAEASRRLEQAGPNLLPRVDRRGPLARLALQFHHPLIYVLLAAAAATFAVGEPVDAAVVLAVVLVNALIGFLQEARAEKALDALVEMLLTRATVVRDGARHEVPSEELVPGDVVLLETGDKVPADLRLLSVSELHIDESALTGESLPVAKSPLELPGDTGLADRDNIAHSGTLVTRGVGRGVVVATGADTEIGHVHRLVGQARALETPLTRKLHRFSRVLTVAILALAAVTFALGLLRGESAPSMLTAAVALAVGAIPEGLPAVVTITLAIGVARMARRRAIIRRLPAVETLGSTTVVCTDKTGTLTANAMTVTAVDAGGRRWSVTGTGYVPEGVIVDGDVPADLAGQPTLRECLVAGALCNDSAVQQRDGRWQVIGDPTEAALLVAADKGGLDRAALAAALPRLDAVPFDSDRRYMATLHRAQDGRVVAYVKGAVERVLDLAQSQLAADGTTEPLDRDAVLARAEQLSSQALRLLALATVELPVGTATISEEQLDGRLVLLGLQAMYDPPRPAALTAVEACRVAGIEVKMITGDHAGTARAIAERFGLGGAAGPVAVTGAELAACPDEDLADLAERTSVFARVSPEQKLRLVETLQERGHVVAMTGDGVNDAPALRRADIGIAMGLSGTEVAKEAADMVLTDDDFASIEAAVEEGRGVFDNLRKFIAFILPTSVGQGMIVLTAVALATALPLLPVQVLWVNMTTAVALGLVLAFEPLEPDVMRRPPVPVSRPLLTRGLVRRIVLVAGLMVLGAFAVFEGELLRGGSLDEARTAAVNVVVAVQVAYLFNCRSLHRASRGAGAPRNTWLPVGVGAMVVLQVLFTYAPVMHELFHSAPVGASTWLWVIAVAAVVYLVVEVEKWVLRARAGSSDAPPSHSPAGSGRGSGSAA